MHAAKSEFEIHYPSNMIQSFLSDPHDEFECSTSTHDLMYTELSDDATWIKICELYARNYFLNHACDYNMNVEDVVQSVICDILERQADPKQPPMELDYPFIDLLAQIWHSLNKIKIQSKTELDHRTALTIEDASALLSDEGFTRFDTPEYLMVVNIAERFRPIYPVQFQKYFKYPGKYTMFELYMSTGEPKTTAYRKMTRDVNEFKDLCKKEIRSSNC